jgi:hypothetical protein
VRVEVSVTPSAGGREWTVSLSFVGQKIHHQMQRAEGALPVRPVPAPDRPRHELDDEPARTEICKRIASCKPERGDVELMGSYLFDALIGVEAWAAIEDAATAGGEPMIELALTWKAGDLDTPKWELMHDGNEFLAAFRARAVAIIRIVRDAPDGARAGERLKAPARVLFVVGSDLDDPEIRAGAEIMGLLRRVEEGRGAIIPFVLEHASVEALRREARRLNPDVVHFVTHGRVHEGRGELSMQGEDAAAHISASQLLEALSDDGGIPLPAVAVVTACESAATNDHTVPFSVELVKGGIPIVVGMTGVVSDPVCRLFSNRFGAALTDGEPLVRALTDGRRAALWHASGSGNGPDTSVDWGLPALFLAPSVQSHHVVVDLAGTDEMLERIDAFGLQQKPVFCGRRKFMRLLDRLLDQRDPLNVLVAAVERPNDGEVGETRLVHELARRALRGGHVVMMLSAGSNGTRSEPPTTPALLAIYLLQELFETHRRFGLAAPRDAAILDALARAAGTSAPDIASAPDSMVHQRLAEYCKQLRRDHSDWKDRFEADVLREALASDLASLQARARARRDPSLAEQCRVIVLLERVERWGETTVALAETLLTPTGFGVGDDRVPVILTCTVNDDMYFHRLRTLEERASVETWIHVEPLERFGEKEDMLAYQWMLLNPYLGVHPPHSEKVFVRTEPTDDWATMFRTNISGLPSRFGREFYIVASTLSFGKILTEDDNDEVKLRAYARECQ